MAKVPGDSETARLIEQAVRGDQRALGEQLGRHRERLRRMVALRLDRRLQGRVDPSDVIQEACLDAARRLPEYDDTPRLAVLWLGPNLPPRRPDAPELGKPTGAG